MKTSLDFGIFFPLGAKNCFLRLRTTIVKKSDCFGKRTFVQFFFRTRVRLFWIFWLNVPTAFEKLHPTCPEDRFAGKPSIENLSFYMFLRTLSEESLVIRPKEASSVRETALHVSRFFSWKNKFFVKKVSCKPFSDCGRKMFGRIEKKRLTVVSNLQSTCPDDRSDEKTFLQR